MRHLVQLAGLTIGSFLSATTRIALSMRQDRGTLQTNTYLKNHRLETKQKSDRGANCVCFGTLGRRGDA